MPASPFGMDNQFGRVAIVNSTPALGSACTGTSIVDFVGYGATSGCYEGLAPTANLSNVTNKLYADSLYSGHYVPGAGRVFQLTANIKF